MTLLIPIGAFAFVMAGFGASARIHQGKEWAGLAFLSAIGFTACLTTTLIALN